MEGNKISSDEFKIYSGQISYYQEKDPVRGIEDSRHIYRNKEIVVAQSREHADELILEYHRFHFRTINHRVCNMGEVPRDSEVSLKRELAILGKISHVILPHELEHLVADLDLPHTLSQGFYICRELVAA